MKRKIALITLALVLAFSAGATFAASAIKIVVNGKTANADARIINNTTYVPLRAVSEMLGANVDWNQKTQTVTITSAGTTADSATVKTVNGVTIEISRVEQDSDSLRVYIKYTNTTKNEINTAESLSKIVMNGKQYDYDTMFNFDRYYNKGVPKAPYSLEPGASADSVLFFPADPGASTVNVTVSPEFNSIRFTDIKIINL